MEHLQALLDRYPDIGAGCTVHLAPGVYPENVTVAGHHGGLLIAGAGDGADPATATHLIGQGGPANLDVLLITAGGPEAASPTTVRGVRVTSPDGMDAGPLYGGVTLDATPAAPKNGIGGPLQFVRVEHLTVTGITGEGAGCGILITGSPVYADLVSDVSVAGCRLIGNDHSGLLVTQVRTARLSIGKDSTGRHSLFLANGGSGFFLLGDPPPENKSPGQFADTSLSCTAFCDNAPYDIELRWAEQDIDASNQVTFVGAASLAEIEARVWHENDDPLLGLVIPAAPDVTGNRLSWDPWAYCFTLGETALSAGTRWYNLATPAGAQVQILVLNGSGSATAAVQAIDLTGEEHEDAFAVTVDNALHYRWYLKGSSLSRLSEVSALAGRETVGTYEALRNRTTYGRTTKLGLWVVAHDILAWDRLPMAIEQPGP